MKIKTGAPAGTPLGDVQDRLADSGLTLEQIGAIVGRSRQGVFQFLKASSVQTKTLDDYIRLFGAR